LVEKGIAKTRHFRPQSDAPESKKHLLDVSDMLWTSGESSILSEMANIGSSDYLVYGRVFAYDSETKLLKVELTIENRLNGQKLSTIGEGNKGSLSGAVKSAIKKMNADLESFID